MLPCLHTLTPTQLHTYAHLEIVPTHDKQSYRRSRVKSCCIQCIIQPHLYNNLNFLWFVLKVALTNKLYTDDYMYLSDGTNPSWDLLGYHPQRSSAKALSGSQAYLHAKLPAVPIPAFSAAALDPTWRLDADVVIVGSGAGGGVMAHELGQ